MIKNEELGLTIAENPKEAMWSRVVLRTKEDIKGMTEALEINNAFLEMAESKLNENQTESVSV